MPFSDAARGAAAHATDVRTINPVDAGGAVKASFKVVKHVGHGVCQPGSYQTGTAYRCTAPAAAAGVLDPCWPLAAPAKTMVCQAKPWVHKLVQVHVRNSAAGGTGFRAVAVPWGLRIGAKTRCLHDVGSVGKVDGHPLIYHCSHHHDVFGPLRDGGSTWKAHVYRTHAHTRSGYKSLGWRTVVIAWQGADAPPPATPTPTPSGLL
jgi:hypothetical protein